MVDESCGVGFGAIDAAGAAAAFGALEKAGMFCMHRMGVTESEECVSRDQLALRLELDQETSEGIRSTKALCDG